MDRVRLGDVLVPWECITQTLVLFRDKAKPRSGFNLITVQMIARRQEHFGAEMLAPCGNMSCGSGAVESHRSVPWEEAPYFKGLVIFHRNIGGQFWELCRKQQHSVQKAPEQAVLAGSGANSSLLPAWELWPLRVWEGGSAFWEVWGKVIFSFGHLWHWKLLDAFKQCKVHTDKTVFPTKEMGFESNLTCTYFLLLLVGCFDSKFEEMIL